MKNIFIILLLLFSATLAQASEINFALIKINIDNRGEALITHLNSYDSRAGEEVNFKVLDNKNLRVFDNQGELEFTQSNGTVTFFPRDFVENYGVTIEYNSSSLTSKTAGEWNFELELIPLNEFNELKFELALPRDVILSIYEPQALVYLGDESLELEWSFEKVSNTIHLNTIYVFSDDPDAGSENEFPFVLIGLSLFTLIIAGILFYYFVIQKQIKKVKIELAVPKETLKPKEKEGLSSRQTDMLKLLNENEEKIVKVLLGESNIAQRNLMAKTSLPKSTLSRTLKKLELKGLIKINNIGSTNKIELSKEFREKQ